MRHRAPSTGLLKKLAGKEAQEGAEEEAEFEADEAEVTDPGNEGSLPADTRHLPERTRAMGTWRSGVRPGLRPVLLRPGYAPAVTTGAGGRLRLWARYL